MGPAQQTYRCWAGREWTYANALASSEAALAARRNGDLDNAPIYLGHDAGLIDSIKPAGEFIQEMVAEAEEIIKGRLQTLLR
jgi:nitronate monooxygenase